MAGAPSSPAAPAESDSRARELAQRGAHVVIADLNADAAATVAAAVNGEAWVVDLSDTVALDDLTLDADILTLDADILVEPEEVASLAGWLVSEQAGVVTGASYTMDGGWTARWAPTATAPSTCP